MGGFKVRKRLNLNFKKLLLLTGCILMMAGLFIPGPGRADGESAAQVRVMVQAGDTLWGLAKNHGPQDRDLRLVVDEIIRLSGLESSCIYPGQVVIIPRN